MRDPRGNVGFSYWSPAATCELSSGMLSPLSYRESQTLSVRKDNVNHLELQDLTKRECDQNPKTEKIDMANPMVEGVPCMGGYHLEENSAYGGKDQLNTFHHQTADSEFQSRPAQ